MTTLVSTAINQIRRELYGTHRSELNWLAADVSSGATAFTFIDELSGLARGSYIGIGDELVYVRSVVPSARSATVVRAMLGTTAVAHSTNDQVEVNPRFAAFSMRDAIADEIRSWPANLFAVGTVDIPTSANVRGYDLVGVTDQVLFILDARISAQQRANVGGSVGLQSIQNAWPRVSFSFVRNLPLTQFPSGMALFLDRVTDNTSIRVSYAKPFNTSDLSDSVDLESVVGLSTNMLDILDYGAMWRLVAPREIKRNFTEGQGEPRHAEEVPPGAQLNSARVYKAMRDERIANEIMRLRTLWPVVSF